MTINVGPQFPNISTPISDANGNITDAWRQLLMSLWTNLNTLNAQTGNLTSRLAASEQAGSLLSPLPPPP